MSSGFIRPRWLRDLLSFLPLKSQFVLSGNVKDLQTQEVSSGRVMTAPLVSVLSAELGGAGFARGCTGWRLDSQIRGSRN